MWNQKYKQDRNLVKKWLILGLLKRVFSGQPDNILRKLRKVIATNNNEFPLQLIIDEFKGKRNHSHFLMMKLIIYYLTNMVKSIRFLF